MTRSFARAVRAVRTVRSAAVAAATATVLTVTALTAHPALAAPADPEPVPGTELTEPEPEGMDGAGDASVGALLERLQGLYARAEAASEAYNGTAEKLKRQRAATRRAQAALTRAHADLTAGRTQAGRLARQQYRGAVSGLPPSVQVLLSRDPYALLERGHLLRRVAGDQAATVRRLTSGERRATALAQRARGALERQRKLTSARKARRDEARERLKEVESMLASLSGEELAEVRGLEDARTDAAQEKLEDSGALGGTRAPSSAGERALEYAREQIGKPYRWGAEGPSSYDCSGLTSQAWQHAARAIPRTSQEQWRQLKRVPLRELRPGDLVVYYRGATHVGLYAGDGEVVEAPRPGEDVKLSPVASNPVLGAVRPDPGKRES
ncbi:C40 family peptidase [Streptomyces sp. NPDC048172]|uniref:C40 family peptidase n=1 Tax=Streptomyces sp. NPDC048172 TaxID=3365505 RepID=UPI003711E753